MDGKKQMGDSSSSSSFASDLFGSKDSSASSSLGIFGSIFSPSSKVLGRESLRSEVVEKKQDSPSQTLSVGAVKVKIRAYQIGIRVIFIRNKQYNLVISAHRYIMGVKTSILILKITKALNPLRSIKMVEKMIQEVLQEEIGGKGPYITKSSPLMACKSPIYLLRYFIQ
ncbi:E3 ubiquitin-protein ligase RLIM-like protein [Actinidia rufa]|uniref:E3 ubiquitin-protein ligase RLIM-like protein n=1 Tax=Actinidia rufa TaxID=165716 RepID=A0A7J0EBL1_9ERIC|nr:E3 ubiquitin-protein ligase RLIM-like protein [Actinidia rufa]